MTRISIVRVVEDLAAMWERMGKANIYFTPSPPSTSVEVWMLRFQLCKEMRKAMIRDCLMLRIWKIVKDIFTFVVPDKELPRLEFQNFRYFSMPNESWNCVTPLKDLDSNIDTT
ncbi:hypothetical protein EJD97_010889 [Solanum chilense]|uniref:Uncharacterized protein n=1 Tax=Solanum chilense TaxID=4083 RepID=A0A6N2BGZ8_SOLCI|nr:hypothetical protein EJD97_010889 [Solanum chilense]